MNYCLLLLSWFITRVFVGSKLCGFNGEGEGGYLVWSGVLFIYFIVEVIKFCRQSSCLILSFGCVFDIFIYVTLVHVNLFTNVNIIFE